MKCKYYDRCEYASSTAITCTENGGGTYCGKFRVFSSESSQDASALFLCHSVTHVREMLV